MITRLHVRRTLGAIWLLDGLLQTQPAMFGPRFSHDVLDPVIPSGPHVITDVVRSADALVAAHPAALNAVFAVVQLGLGIWLLTSRRPRAALAASIVWALGVWSIGEGFGGLWSGATLPVGAPGAALLYAVLAVLVWPSRPGTERPRSRRALASWCSLWILAAALQVVSLGSPGESITMDLRMAASSAPGWVAGADRDILRWGLPTWTSAAFAGLFLLVALWSLIPGSVRQASLFIGTTVALASWVLVQGFGDPTSGLATDPNSGPLIVLVACAVYVESRDQGRHLVRATRHDASIDDGRVDRLHALASTAPLNR